MDDDSVASLDTLQTSKTDAEITAELERLRKVRHKKLFQLNEEKRKTESVKALKSSEQSNAPLPSTLSDEATFATLSTTETGRERQARIRANQGDFDALLASPQQSVKEAPRDDLDDLIKSPEPSVAPACFGASADSPPIDVQSLPSLLESNKRLEAEIEDLKTWKRKIDPIVRRLLNLKLLETEIAKNLVDGLRDEGAQLS